MKGLEEILEAHKDESFAEINSYKMETGNYVWPEEIVKKMIKQAVHQALEEAAEKARMKYHCGTYKTDRQRSHIQIGADNVTVDKQSILELKNNY